MKKLTKIFAVILSFALLFTIASCELSWGNNEETGEPELSTTVTTLKLKVGDPLDLLADIVAKDAKGNDILAQVKASTNAPLDENGCLKQSGNYLIKYVLDLGNGTKLSLQRNLEVIFEIPETDELVVNGDFELGVTDPFTKSEFDNGSATLAVVENEGNHELEVLINSTSWQEPSPRVETNAFALTDGKYYKVSFRARALDARTILVQVGQLISQAPWFYQLGNGYFDLTEEMQEFEFVFKADSAVANDLSNIQLLFGFGTMANGTTVATTCYLDDIKIEETKLESLLKVEAVNPELGEEAHAVANPGTLDVWYDQGGWCGTASEVAYACENGELSIIASQPEGSCWFATQVFLYSTPLAEGEYTLSANLLLSAAGKIQFKADFAAGQAIEAKEFDVVGGNNALSLTFNVAEGQQVGLSLQFGTEANGNIGDFIAVLSDILLVRNGDVQNVEYADPSDLLGLTGLVVNEGEQAAQKDPGTFYVWYVQSADWQCGPAVNASFEMVEGELHLNALLTEEHWWFATQLFLYTKPIKDPGQHVLTFKLVADNAGTITINGQKVELVVGENQISVPFENGAGAPFGLSIQLGWQEEVEGAEPVSHQLLGDNHLVLSDFAIDGQGSTTPIVNPGEAVEFLGHESTVDATLDGEPDAQSHPYTFVDWFDQNWCGSSTSGATTLTEEALTFEVKTVSGSCSFGSQLFYYGEIFKDALTVKFNLNSTVAGQVKINDVMRDIVVGDNEITLAFNAGDQFKLVLVVDTNLGTLTFVMTNFTFGDAEEPAQPEEPTEGIEFLGHKSVVDAALDGENGAMQHLYTFVPWFDQNWCGSKTSGEATLAEGGVVTFEITSVEGSCDFGSQLFYYGETFENATKVSFSLNSTVAGQIKLNGEMVDLVSGDNNLELIFGAGEQFKIQFVVNTQLGAATFVMSGFVAELYTEPAQAQDLSLYVGGTGNQRNHIEGAGVWIWVDMNSISMSDKNFSEYSASVTAENAPAVISTTISDPEFNHGYFRVYAAFESAAFPNPLTIHLTISHGDILFTKDVVFVDGELEGAQNNEPEITDTKDLSFYLQGTENFRNHIEGAGAWIWIDTASAEMTAENLSQYAVSVVAENGPKIENAFMSDFNFDLGIARVYVVFASAEFPESMPVVVTLTCGSTQYVGTITFANNELAE